MAKTTVLDLGSQDGKHIKRIVDRTDVQLVNVFVADVDGKVIQRIADEYGFRPLLIQEDGLLPLGENSIDIIFCSSVIEHVTIDTDEVWKITDGLEFDRRSEDRQSKFANEIRRVGRGYFVQTPIRYFLIESHTWLPFVGYLSRRAQISAIKFANRFWIFYSEPDSRLLDRREMAKLFPEAEIVFKRKCGIAK